MCIRDRCLGDPHSMPHPVRAIGNLIVWLEKYLRPAGKKHATERGERRAGVLFVCLVLLVTGSVAGAILWISRLGGIWIQTVVEAVMTYYLLAARSLRDEMCIRDSSNSAGLDAEQENDSLKRWESCRVAQKPVLLLECMSNLVLNEFYAQENGAQERILQGIKRLQNQCHDLIIVTNEIFSDGKMCIRDSHNTGSGDRRYRRSERRCDCRALHGSSILRTAEPETEGRDTGCGLDIG